MPVATSKLDSPLKITSNNLADIIDWLKDGAYVVVHAEEGRFFHKCNKDEMSKEQIQEFLDSHRVIYIDVSSHRSLLDDGEYNWYIKSEGFDECTCSLKERVSTSKNIPHVTKMKLGY